MYFYYSFQRLLWQLQAMAICYGSTSYDALMSWRYLYTVYVLKLP